MKSLRFLNLLLGIVFSLLLGANSARGQTSPVPFIDILSPTSTYPGHGDFVLTISGANFAAGATVQFDGVTLTPTAVTRNSLTVTVPAAAVASAHTASVTVKDPNSNTSNLIKSNVAFFPITTEKAFVDWIAPFAVLDPPPPFGPNLGPPASGIAVGDFNGDGHQDVIVPIPGLGILQVYLGDGKLNFTPVPNPPSISALGTIQSGTQAIFAEVGDFNNDGNLDVAVTNLSVVAIFFGDGTGALTPGPTTTLPPYGWPEFGYRCGTLHFAVGDINGDGYQDLIFPGGLSHVNPTPLGVVVLLGDGQGHFTLSPAVSAPITNTPDDACGVVIGDFNGDGWLDFAYEGGNGTVFSYNDGTGGFSPTNTYTLSSGNIPFAAGDMNGDGFLDGLASNDIYLNQKNGTFANTGPFLFSSCCDTALGDLAGAGVLDAFGVTSTKPQTTVGEPLIGDGGGHLYANPLLSGASLNPTLLRLGDFNEDGRLDVAYTGFSALSSSNGVAFEYWLQIAGPPLWSVKSGNLGTLVLHLGQLSGNQQQVLTETLSNSGPGTLNIANICSHDPGPANIGTAPTPAGSNPCSTGTGSVNFPISAAASTCPLNGGTPGTNAGALQPGGNCTVAVGFQPTTFGTFSATLSVVDDANGVPGSVQNVTLTGTAIELDANVQPPIKANGTSVFPAWLPAVPIIFKLQENGATVQPSPAGCQLPPATISVVRTAGSAVGPIDTSVFDIPVLDHGNSFRVDPISCQYVYFLETEDFGPGTYTVQILTDPGPIGLGGHDPGPMGIGSATFGLR